MARKALLIGATIVAGAVSAQAHAVMVTGRPVVITQNDTIVFVEFRTSHADNIGNLYFRGSGSRNNVDERATNTDGTGLGQLLFSSEDTLKGTTVQLEGVFKAGDKLHFTYDLLGSAGSTDSGFFKSWSEHPQRRQFAYNNTTDRYAIEDGRRGTSDFDGDFDDMIVKFTFQPVPSPGSLALMSLGLGVACVGRRRRGPASVSNTTPTPVTEPVQSPALA